MKKKHLIIAAVFVIIVIIAAVVIGSSLYDPPEDFEIYTAEAEVIQYAEELNAFLIRENGVLKELRLTEDIVILSKIGTETGVTAVAPGYQIRFYLQLKVHPDLPPRFSDADDCLWYCYKIEIM